MTPYPCSMYGGKSPDCITNPDLLKKIDAAYSLACTKCNTLGTCTMCRDRYIVEARSILDCSVVKQAME